MSSTSNINTLTNQKVAAIASMVLAAYGNIRYLVGRVSTGEKFHVSDTPFTANIIVVLVFWGLMHIMQLSYISQAFVPERSGEVRSSSTIKSGYHFTVFNFLHFLWVYLFAKQHWFFSEVVLIVNFLNIAALYVAHKTYNIKPLSVWLLVHVPVSALPLSWLFYAIFWNGAVLFHVHKLVGRVVSNVLIWNFLLFPVTLLVAYNDYAVGFGFSIILFGIALGQLFTKVFALQWIFAFVISGIVFVLSLVTAFAGSLRPQRRIESAESAPLLE